MSISRTRSSSKIRLRQKDRAWVRGPFKGLHLAHCSAEVVVDIIYIQPGDVLVIGNIWSDSWQSPSCRDTLFYGWLKKQEESHILRIKDPLLSPCGSVKEVSSKPWHGTFISPRLPSPRSCAAHSAPDLWQSPVLSYYPVTFLNPLLPTARTMTACYSGQGGASEAPTTRWPQV